MPTQVPPSRLDSTKDFSSLVPSAFAKANAAFDAANTASGAAATSTPKISSIVYPGNDTAAATAGGQTVTLNGAGFNAGASVLINGSYAGVVSVANSTSLSFTTPSNSGGTYILYVINTDGGTGISVPGISYSGTPSWSNAAGSLATVYETAAVNTQLTATGGVSDGAITYSLQSGTLPPGSSLNSSTGLLSGTSQATESSTTYSFTIRASDEQNQDTDRAFSITINPDVVTWSSPADGTVTALSQDTAMSNVTLSATSVSGQSIAYTANALPTGVTISGSNVTGTPTVLGNTISVITATAANTNRTATRTFTWVVSVSSDPYFKNTTLLLNGEGTSANNGSNNNIFIDSSNNNYAITRTGNATQGSFSPYSVTGWSNYFDGTGDYLSVSTGTIAIGTGDLTLECWGYRTSTTTLQSLVNINAYNTGILIRWETTKVTIYVGGTDYSYNTPTDIPLNSWVHIALVRSGGVFKFYVNGTQATTFNSSYSLSVTSVTIGTSSHDTSEEFYGYISNVRLVNSAIYTTTFTPSTTPLTAIANTSLLTCQSNRFVDNSPNSFALTTGGTPSVQAFSPFGSVPEAVPISYSNFFDGTGDYLTSTTNSVFSPVTGDFTLEAWVYPTTAAGTLNMIFAHYSSGVALYRNTGGKLEIAQDGVAALATSTNNISVNSWSHVVACRSGTTLKLFINGVQEASVTNSTNLTGSGTVSIGGSSTPASNYFTGYLSNLRLVKGTAVYTSAFTPSTTPLTAIANTSLLTCQSTRMIDNSTNNFTLTATGDVKPRIFNPFGYTAQSATSYTPSLHGGSAYFDGTGDYLNASYLSSNFDTGNFTVELWIYNTSRTDYNVILDTRAGATANPFAFGITPSGYLYYYTGTEYASSTVIPLNTWTHVAIARSGTTIKLFQNGVEILSRTDSSNLTGTSTTTITIGRTIHGLAHFFGYMSNFRIVKGTAVYTSGFLPPAAPLTAVTNTSLLLNFTNAGIIDQHGTNVLETVGNTQLSTSIKKYGNSSIYFDGTGDQLKVTGLGPANFGTGDFTIEMWVNVPTNTGTYQCFYNSRNSETGLFFGLNAGGMQLIYYVGGGLITDANVLTTNVWHHVALVRNSGTTTLYKNGVSVGTYADSINYTSTITEIGKDTNFSFDLNGYIDDLRITKGYARYTSNFTPPSALLTK